MTLNQNLCDIMSEQEKQIFEDFCKTLCMDSNSKHAQSMWFEFKKSGLTW